jgi:hypothetical protein
MRWAHRGVVWGKKRRSTKCSRLAVNGLWGWSQEMGIPRKTEERFIQLSWLLDRQCYKYLAEGDSKLQCAL